MFVEFEGTLVTGFGSFGAVLDNPSSVLAQASGANWIPLRVSFAAVDQFLATLDPNSFNALFLMGVAAGRSHVSLESIARNMVGKTPDVDGTVAGPGLIDADGPGLIRGTLWPESLIATTSGDLEASEDAGDYLCNYLYFRALQKFPEHRIGFLHVVSFDSVSFARQLVIVRQLLRAVSAPLGQ